MSLKSSPPVETPAPRETTVERPHLFALLLALIDARVSHVDVMDTDVEAELERYYRGRHAAQRAARAASAEAPAPRDRPVSS